MSTDMIARAHVAAARRVVIKIGTSVLMRHDGRVAIARLHGHIESIAALHEAGWEVLVVSSGAVGVGAGMLMAPSTEHSVARHRAAAAMGQGQLIACYADAFAHFGIGLAQLLLTGEDFASEERRALIRETLQTLRETRVIPVVNENDAASSRHVLSPEDQPFQDNDMLAALVTKETEASLLILLSDVDGLYTADPGRNASVELISFLNGGIDRAAYDAEGIGAYGRGGMAAKMCAAQVAMHSGAMVVIANGHRAGIIDAICRGDCVGTLVIPERAIA